MRIAVIGATGRIGRAVVSHLKARHEVIEVAHNHGDYQVRISNRGFKLYDQL